MNLVRAIRGGIIWTVALDRASERDYEGALRKLDEMEKICRLTFEPKVLKAVMLLRLENIDSCRELCANLLEIIETEYLSEHYKKTYSESELKYLNLYVQSIFERCGSYNNIQNVRFDNLINQINKGEISSRILRLFPMSI